VQEDVHFLAGGGDAEAQMYQALIALGR